MNREEPDTIRQVNELFNEITSLPPGNMQDGMVHLKGFLKKNCHPIPSTGNSGPEYYVPFTRYRSSAPQRNR